MLDIQKLRADTPGCTTKVHFNNAGASLMPSPVVKAIQNHILLEAGSGGYEAADASESQIRGFYDAAARLLNCKPEQVAFTSSATNSFSRALSSIPFRKGDKVLLANEDYISNQIAFLYLQKHVGVELLRSKSLPEGGVDLDDMERLMKAHSPRLVALSHIPTNTGLVQPAGEVGKLCKKYELTYLLDACQSAGQLPIDVEKLQCDFLSGTFRKFLRGPRGAGFLYISDSVLNKNWESMLIDMRGADWVEPDRYQTHRDARQFEEWEMSYALVLGAKAAIEYAIALGLEEIQKRNEFLCGQVRQMLNGLGLRTLDKGRNVSSIITVEIPGKKPEETVNFLRSININTTASTRPNAIIDFSSKGVEWALRISPHYFNTEEEIDVLEDGLRKWISK